MTLFAARAVAVRSVSRKAPVQQQKRTIVDYLTNYPDKVRQQKINLDVRCESEEDPDLNLLL